MDPEQNFSELISNLTTLDKYLTHKIAICSNKNNENVLLKYFRNVLMIVELSFHGIPWFFFVIYFLITNNASYGHICRPILAGRHID